MRHAVVGGKFAGLDVFGFSAIGILSGMSVGFITVLIAAQSPAKRAAKVSPVSAVPGNTGNTKPIRRTLNTHLAKIETILGIHHAVSAKKNFILVTGSFSLSIILFLSFSVMTELVGYLLPLNSSSPDYSIVSRDLSNTVKHTLINDIAGLPTAKYLYDTVITAHFSYYTWSVPIKPVVIILLVVLTSAVASIYVPSKRIRNMVITETINEL